MTEHDGQIPGRSVLGWQVRLLLGLVVVMAHVGGVAVVLVLVAVVLPSGSTTWACSGSSC